MIHSAPSSTIAPLVRVIDQTRPPTRSRASSTVTSTPRSASTRAARQSRQAGANHDRPALRMHQCRGPNGLRADGAHGWHLHGTARLWYSAHSGLNDHSGYRWARREEGSHGRQTPDGPGMVATAVHDPGGRWCHRGAVDRRGPRRMFEAGRFDPGSPSALGDTAIPIATLEEPVTLPVTWTRSQPTPRSSRARS